jgi:hypothetical protein
MHIDRSWCDRADGDAQKPAQKPAQYVKVFLAKTQQDSYTYSSRYLQAFLAKYLHIVAHSDIRAAHHCAGICNCVVICLKKYLQIPNPSGPHTAQCKYKYLTHQVHTLPSANNCKYMHIVTHTCR